MKSLLPLLAACCLPTFASGQTLPSSMSFTVTGKFTNAVAESSDSLLIADNKLTNGYASGSDLYNAPSDLSSTGPAGSAFFQWGKASTSADYPHPSALWFSPIAATNVTPEQSFDLGYLYYRNGTIQSGTGASSVDISLSFTLPGSTIPIVTNFTSELINTPNTGTAEQNADTVSLVNSSTPIAYTDSSGHTYYLKLTVDDVTLNSTLSTASQFRVVEGATGRATLSAMFTIAPQAVPEPSAALLGAAASLLLFRRQRKAA